MIEKLSGFPGNVLAFACHGTVTKADYENVLIPAVNDALNKQTKVRLYYEIPADFHDITPGAMWEDFMTGMGHRTQWERVALITDVEWMRKATAFFHFVLPCPMKLFSTAAAAQAREWIVGSD